VITGTGWRRGGGPATWARWSMARASASTLDGARALKARGSSRSRRLPATTSRAQWGCMGACQKGRRRAVSDRTAAWRTSRTKNRAGRQATGILKTLRAGPWRPAPLLFDSAKTFARERPGDLARHSRFSTKGPPSESAAPSLHYALRGCGVRQETYSPGPYRSSRELSLTRSLDRDTRRPPTL
jgi:hypothetical protein